MESIPDFLPGQRLSDHMASEAQQIQRRMTSRATNSASEGANFKDEISKLAGMFIYQMLQAMRRTVPKSDLLKQGFSHDVYQAMFDQEVADQIARRGNFGLTNMLVEQLDHQRPDTSISAKSVDAIHHYARNQQAHDFAFHYPVRGKLSSSYGWRIDPIDRERRFHQGIDIAAPKGAVIQAASQGRVSFSGKRGGYGQLIIIDHADGYQTYYAHNEENLVSVGDQVRRGQPIAHIGETGRATGTHLHFEVRKDGNAIDPAKVLSFPSSASHLLPDFYDR